RFSRDWSSDVCSSDLLELRCASRVAINPPLSREPRTLGALSGAARTALAERGRSAGSSARRDPSALAQGATNVGRAQRRGADFTRGEGRSAGPSGPRGTRAQRNRGVPLGELRCPLGGGPELGPVEAGIDAALPEQLLVPSLLDDAAVLQD